MLSATACKRSCMPHMSLSLKEDEDRIIERLLAQSEARRHLLARLKGEPAACLNGLLRELHSGWPDDPGSQRSLVVTVTDLPKGHDFKDWAHQLKASQPNSLCEHDPACAGLEPRV